MDAKFNYLSAVEKWDTVKPYEITGQVSPGLPRNNFEFTSYSATVSDARLGDTPSLDTTGFECVNHTTIEPLDTPESISKHLEATELFLKKHLQADEVLTFQYQVRPSQILTQLNDSLHNSRSESVRQSSTTPPSDLPAISFILVGNNSNYVATC